MYKNLSHFFIRANHNNPRHLRSITLILSILISASCLAQINYFEKKVIVKVKPQYRAICTTDKITNPLFNQLYTSIGGAGLQRKFPHVKRPINDVHKNGVLLVDLTLIYEFNYTADVSLNKVISKFIALQLFEYVEPHYIPHLCYTPNDSALSTQYAIAKIQAEAAWGINTTTARGDTNIIIGITDTGIEPNHPDLKNNIKHNYNDPIDGLDNDNDGYTDNFSGWDFGENDNDPSYNKSAHGVMVSGIAAASTDNTIGIAGVGFNCKFLPIKILDTAGIITSGYEGIVYAADQGCAIINCSWGGSSSGQLGQDVITYATINKNALVIAAAGNDASEEGFYPASYQYVLSVANTNSVDSVSATSNYGYDIDVCAPGESIYSTSPTNSYNTKTGTSLSSPCVAGAAAIIKSFYPSYTALQIGEQLKTTCDTIYSINAPLYIDKLGGGRINLFNALTQNSSPAIVMTLRNETDNNDDLFFTNDTIQVTGNYTNFLAPVTNVIATLSTTSSFVNILDSTSTLGPIPMLGITNNTANPFKIQILPNAPPNQQIVFKLTYTDAATSYVHSECFTLTINVGYLNIAINDVALSVSDNGRIGYHEEDQIGGLGFTYLNGYSLFYEAGLMVGDNGAQISDGIRSAGPLTDNDFQPLTTTNNIIPSVHSDYAVDATFNDYLAAIPLPVSVHQTAFAWTSAGDRKYVILKYIIKNISTIRLVNLYAGIFADWDINALTFASNRISFDAYNKMGYAYYTGANGIYAGIKLLSNSAPVVHYAIDHIVGGAGGLDLKTGGFDGDEKYIALSTNRNNAGVSGAGNDVIDVLSTGPFIMEVGDSIEVAFALIAGDSLLDLQKSAINAQVKYEGIANIRANDDNAMVVYPNPTNGRSIIDIFVSEETRVELKIVNIFGQAINTIISEKMLSGPHRIVYETFVLASGCYYYQLIIGEKRYIKKLIVSR